MALLTRRRLIQGAALVTGTGSGLGAYAGAVEPGLLLNVTRYDVNPPGWPSGLRLRIGVIADIHACEPWMGPARIRHIAEVTNGLDPDLIVLLGDFHGGHNIVTSAVVPEQWGEALSVLKAPLGVHAILGNHDWWHGPLPRDKGDDGESVRKALRAARFNFMENDALRLEKNGSPFWLLGLGDQMAYRTSRFTTAGVDDLDGTMRKISDLAPAILLAHEPYVFRHVPERISLTLSGHTHGGQVHLPFDLDRMLRPGRMYQGPLVYGHMNVGNRHIVVSGGLGTSIAPIRFLRPPEVVEVNVFAAGAAAS